METKEQAATGRQIDWEQRRYEIARSALVGCLASPIVEGVDPNPSIFVIAHHCTLLADALIKELRDGRINYWQ